MILSKTHPNFAVKICSMEKIFLDPKSRKELVKRYGAPNVSKALNFVSNSFMSREIRHAAMNRYNGVIVNYYSVW